MHQCEHRCGQEKGRIGMTMELLVKPDYVHVILITHLNEISELDKLVFFQVKCTHFTDYLMIRKSKVIWVIGEVG